MNNLVPVLVFKNREALITLVIIYLFISIYNVFSAGKISNKLLRLYIIVNFNFIISALLLILQYKLHPLIGIILPNTLIFLNFTLILLTTEYVFINRFSSHFLLYLLPFYIIILCYFTFISYDLKSRIIISSIIGVIASLTIILRLLMLLKTFPTAPLAPFIFILSITGNISLIRGILTYFSYYSSNSILEQSVMSQITWISAIVVQLSWNILIIRNSLLTERDKFANLVHKQSQLQEEIDLLHNIFDRNRDELNIMDITTMVFQFITRNFDITAGAFYLFSENKQRVILIDHFGLSKEIIRENKIIPYRGSIVDKVIQHKEIVRFQSKDILDERFQNQLNKLDYTEFTGIPLVVRDKVLGAFFLANRGNRGLLQQNIDVIDLLSRQIAIIVNNFQLYINLNNSERKYRFLFDLAEDGLVVNDLEGNIISTNSKFTSMTGYTKDRLINVKFLDIVSDSCKGEYVDKTSNITLNNSVSFEINIKKLDGSDLPVWINSSVIIYNKRRALYSVIRDMRERKEMEREIHKLATTDSLTGIINRREFLNRFSEQLNYYKRYRDDLTLFMVDIDDFKSINDSYGHQTGDMVIKTITSSFVKLLRKTDIFGRYGGEEFVGILFKTDHITAKQVFDKILEHIRSNKIVTNNGNISVTVSIGFTSIGENDKTQDEIIQRADKALYISKKQGKDRYNYV